MVARMKIRRGLAPVNLTWNLVVAFSFETAPQTESISTGQAGVRTWENKDFGPHSMAETVFGAPYPSGRWLGFDFHHPLCIV